MHYLLASYTAELVGDSDDYTYNQLILISVYIYMPS